ncbi:MAG: fumarylacetoacetate hydrolase family protein [Planctomycetota bacterium]
MPRRSKPRDLYEWAQNAHSVWTTFGNSKAAEASEGMPVRPTPFPHFNAPTSLKEDESVLVIPELASTVTIGVELACRVLARGERLSKEEAQELIASYHVFVAVRDSSHYEYALQMSNFPHYGKADDPTWDIDYQVPQAWADGFNIVSKAGRDVEKGFPENAEMRLELAGRKGVRTNTSEYVHRFASVMSVITKFVCVDQGDVITLGRAGDVITLFPGKNLPKDAKLTASIAGVGRLAINVIDLRSADNYYTRSRKGASAGAFV